MVLVFSGILKSEKRKYEVDCHEMKKIRTDLQNTTSDSIQKRTEWELESKNHQNIKEDQLLDFTEALNDKDSKIKELSERNKILEDNFEFARLILI